MNFSVLLEEVKMKAACQLLIQGDCTLNEIVHELGYSDQAHFAHTFRRWTGVAPGVYRRFKEQGDTNAMSSSPSPKNSRIF